MMTRKRLLLIVFACTVGVMIAAFFAHPYGRQLAFGPKIRGVPLWSWQQQFRKRYANPNDDFLANALAPLGVQRAEATWNPDPDLLPVVLSLVDEPDDQLRAHVAQNLGYYPGSAPAGEALTVFLDDPSETVRHFAASAFVNMNLVEPYMPALAKLREHMEDESEICRLHAAIAAYQIDRKPDEKTIRILRKKLLTGKGYERQYAATGLCIMGDAAPESLPEVADQARTSIDVRYFFAYYGGGYGPRAVPALVELLSAPEPGVRMSAARSLGKLGPEGKPAIPALVRALNDPYEPTRTAAADALSKIDPERYPQKKDSTP
jgi:HEAT repeat protein